LNDNQKNCPATPLRRRSCSARNSRRATSSSANSALTKTFINTDLGFALNMTADFSAYPPHASPARHENGAPTDQAIV
jgi:hypothetical protein